MNTPVCDFIEEYAKKATVRLHMPGHKGNGGIERQDITEIDGADSLYEAVGILAESEKNAGALFGSHAFYSAEGSSLAIRAMLYLCLLYARENGRALRVAAGRNAHKVFVSGAALLGLDVDWLTSKTNSYLSCPLCANDVACYLDEVEEKPVAVYITSPDYLGNMVDVKGIARVCHERDVLLLVDNAHGAYLKFLSTSRHPMDQGADMCADSAHKTLHALTGAAYLHVSRRAPAVLHKRAKDALALFGSTSPSYLILASLDRLNVGLAEGYCACLAALVTRISRLKEQLRDAGFSLVGDEPLKVTVAPKSYGYTGKELAGYLMDNNFTPEFYDPDFLVLMLSDDIEGDAIEKLVAVMTALPKRSAISNGLTCFGMPERVLKPIEAMTSAAERVPVEKALGRVLAGVTVGCPPAVPIAVSGERIDERIIQAFLYYGIESCLVVKEEK